MPKSRNEGISSNRMSLIIYGVDITGMKLMMSYSVYTSFLFQSKVRKDASVYTADNIFYAWGESFRVACNTTRAYASKFSGIGEVGKIF